MKKNKKESIILGSILKGLASKIGAKVILEPKWGIAGQITFKNGKRSYFRFNTLDLNSVGSADIAKDKDYANFFMNSMGYSIVPNSKTFFHMNRAKVIGLRNRDIDSGYKYAKKIGFPVIVKPNGGSQGVGVCKVFNKSEFYRAVKTVFKSDYIVIVQSPVSGKDYRIVVLDDKVISAYERVPLSIVGNGKSTIKELLTLKQDDFFVSKRDTQIKVDDPRIKEKLKRQGFTMNSILDKDAKVFLLDNANLSTGGDSIDVTDKIHPDFKKIAVNLTKDMGLRICGVDLMVEGDISQKPSKYWILEINAAPGLDHYAKKGKAQEQKVKDLYFEVLKHLEK